MRLSNPIQQLKLKPKSKAAAIKAKCAECVGCEDAYIEKGFKETISACSSYSCPLHSFRPYQAKKSLERPKKTLQRCQKDTNQHE